MYKNHQFLGTFEDTFDRFSFRTRNTAWTLQWVGDLPKCNNWHSINYLRVNRHFLLTMLHWKQTIFSLQFVCRGNVHHTLYGSSVGNQPALLLALFFFHGSSVGFRPTLLISSDLCCSPWYTANLPFFHFMFSFCRLLTAYKFLDWFCRCTR